MPQSKFSYTITLTATSEAEAKLKIKAASHLCAKLTTSELEKLANAVNDPIKVKLAKAWL